MTTDLVLNKPRENDFYDINVFNENFSRIENAINALTRSVRTLTDEAASPTMVTGVMTAIGAMNLGWRPKAVFVFASRFFGNTTGFANMVAMSIREHHQSYDTTKLQLRIDANGFTVWNMRGSSFLGHEEATAADPLRYIALK